MSPHLETFAAESPPSTRRQKPNLAARFRSRKVLPRLQNRSRADWDEPQSPIRTLKQWAPPFGGHAADHSNKHRKYTDPQAALRLQAIDGVPGRLAPDRSDRRNGLPSGYAHGARAVESSVSCGPIHPAFHHVLTLRVLLRHVH